MSYDPKAYWDARGGGYLAAHRPEKFAAQEAALREVLAGIDFVTVLDAGCGFGRVGRLVLERNPDAIYTGVDGSADMLEAARAYLPESALVADLVHADLRDFKTTETFDLVVAAEVLMHVPPEHVAGVVRKLDRLATTALVTVDWTEPVGRKTSPHNFRHDYDALLGKGPFGRRREVEKVRVGLQTIHVVRK